MHHFSDDVIKLNPGLAQQTESKPASKYHNVRTEAKGLRFDSGHEAAVISGLILQEAQHLIFGLRLQVRFPLSGNTVYVADATYFELIDGKLELVVLDAKGVRTPTYKLKKKLFKEKYGIEITEV